MFYPSKVPFRVLRHFTHKASVTSGTQKQAHAALMYAVNKVSVCSSAEGLLKGHKNNKLYKTKLFY